MYPALDAQNQAYCYIDDDGNVQGFNTQKLMGIASVAKTITTMHAIEKYGKNYQFESKVYVNNGNIHITGGNNPVFDRRFFYHLLNALNKNGITHAQKISYDAGVFFEPQLIDTQSFTQAKYSVDGKRFYCQYYEPSNTDPQKFFEKYFDTSNWNKLRTEITDSGQCITTEGVTITEDYEQKRNLIGSFQKNLEFSFESISYNPQNPFETSPGVFLPGTKVITLKSIELIKIANFTNRFSQNGIADTLFFGMGGKQAVLQRLADRFNVNDDTYFENNFQLLSGSGYALKEFEVTNSKGYIPGYKLIQRKRTKASCQFVLQTFELMLNQANGYLWPLFDGFEIPERTINDIMPYDYMAVGKIEGTLTGRFLHSNVLTAKTGTLGDASTLGGTLSTQTGKRQFAVINNYYDANYKTASKNIQNGMVTKMFDSFGGEKTFPYNAKNNDRKSFIPFDPNIEIKQY